MACDEGNRSASHGRDPRPLRPQRRPYDLVTGGGERTLTPGRAALWRRVRGPRVLEVGVGTGRGMEHYRPELTVIAIDFSPRMLEQARRRAARDHIQVDLREADVQALPFPHASFDTFIATCVFCSVPDSVLGPCELRRVLVPGGQLLLLEHVLSHRPLFGPAMRLLNPLAVRLSGANINRETVENVRRAGFVGVQAEDRWLDIIKHVEAQTPTSAAAG
jgi:ubiquinone/menaquinone biosynthesis C-methylase UbiE